MGDLRWLNTKSNQRKERRERRLVLYYGNCCRCYIHFGFKMNIFPYAPICNCNPHRAPRFEGYSFPLCWRCTAIIFALFALHLNGPLWLAMVLILPCLIDGTAQYGFGFESSNLRRIITGLLAGSGIAMILGYYELN